MIEHIRANVVSGFDRLYEDAIAFFYEYKDPEAPSYRWHTLICDSGFQMNNMADIYASRIDQKQQDLETLISCYDKLPN